ncbi:MAG: hypothetical protein ACKPKO_45970, partial [Candidatus Fonsibacter sp.]
CRRRGRPPDEDAFLRRATYNKSDGDVCITGPKYFVVASYDSPSPGVRFKLPRGYREKSTIGMNNPWKKSKKRKGDMKLESKERRSDVSALYESYGSEAKGH